MVSSVSTELKKKYNWQLFHECKVDMRWKIYNEARSTELAVNIPYLTSASGKFFFIKNANNIWRILSAIICKNNRFSVCFYFWTEAYSYHIWRAWYNGSWNGSYTMMRKSIRALELHYPMIQFSIIYNYYSIDWLIHFFIVVLIYLLLEDRSSSSLSSSPSSSSSYYYYYYCYYYYYYF